MSQDEAAVSAEVVSREEPDSRCAVVHPQGSSISPGGNTPVEVKRSISGEPEQATPAGEAGRQVGVGPHPQPWPAGLHWDRELLEKGDRRNVEDQYRYWTVEAIRHDLDQRRHGFHVAIENWTHDPNIGTMVRNANAFRAAAVHIVGKRRWNRRGAMMTEVYQEVVHQESVADLAIWSRLRGLPLIGIENQVEGAESLLEADLPRRAVLLFGQEGPGLTPKAISVVDRVVEIPQFGSTRSINAGAASAIIMYEWCRRHASGG